MTKLKPTLPPAVQEQLRNMIAECIAVTSSCQMSLEMLDPSPRLSPDFSADRYDNGLRTVHITGVDGKKRVHRYRTRAPVGSGSCMPSASASKITQTVDSHDEAQRVGECQKLSLSAISMVCIPPEPPSMVQHDGEEDDIFTPPETPVLETSTLCIPPEIPETPRQDEEEEDMYIPPATPALETSTRRVRPASPEADLGNDNVINPFTASEQAFYHWLQTVKPLVIPSILMIITPWALSKYIFLPWLIGRVLRILQMEHALTIDQMLGIPRGLWHAIATLAPFIYQGVAPVLVPLTLSVVLPWKVWEVFYVPWMMSRGLKVAMREERTVSLVFSLVMLGILPGVVWKGVVPWALWKIIGMPMLLFYSLPAIMLNAFVAWVAWSLFSS